MNPRPDTNLSQAYSLPLTVVEPRQLKPLICCTHCGSSKHYGKNGRNKSSRTQIYLCRNCGHSFTPRAEAPPITVDPQAEYLKDVWDARCLGFTDDVGKTSYKLNFLTLQPLWFRKAAKEYLKFCLGRLTFGSVQEKLYALNRLSKFLQASYPSLQPHEFTRSIAIEYRNYVMSLNLSSSSHKTLISEAKLFFDACYQNEWLNITRYILRGTDFPKVQKTLPRYIPECVMEQLNQHLDSLPEPVMRMVLVLQECGMRISELIHLKRDCLLQDKAGDWFLRYYQFKMKKEITIPVSREIVRVIQEQEKYIQKHLPNSFEYLFCSNGGVRSPNFNPVPRLMMRKTLPNYLNRLAVAKNICGDNQQPWHFQTHQFRHTVGTRMINNGVPQHIVQRYLGHESPEMTATYAYIHDQTLKKEISKFRDKVVNIAGEIVQPNNLEAEDIDLQWVKKNIQAQALPNGSCALPTISKGCPHANACLTCTHFRTTAEHLDIHKKEREQTEQILAKAQLNGWQRVVEMNQQVLNNLNNIIGSLEEACP